VSDRDLLARLAQGPCSGAALAKELGLTRAAVWKRIEALRADGVEIEARTGRGYALAAPVTLLDAGRIAALLPPSLRARWPVPEVVWEIDSTNAELIRRGADCPDGLALFAERQRGGRGRRGRHWASPLAANLYLSLHRRFDGGVAALGGLSLVVGIAVAEALRRLGYGAVALKWPNDLLADGRKLGGILIELGGEVGGPIQAVIGLGLNVRMPRAAAQAIDQPWTDLTALRPAAVPDRNALAAALLASLWPALDDFARDGLAPFLPRWAALDAFAGREVRLLLGDAVREGVALGIAADGGLRVRHGDGGERVYHSGEVSLRAGATE
jgi:BirA family biotin operon repressor/biotin-[acetyl-CoA-carboxylase] ligase